MNLQKLKKKTLNEKELKEIVTDYPELIEKDLRVLASEVQISDGKVKLDKVFVKDQDLVILQVCQNSDPYKALYDSANLYNQIKKDFLELKGVLNQNKLKDIKVLILQKDFDESTINIVKLFKEDYPLSLYTYDAYETEDDKLSVFFHEVKFKIGRVREEKVKEKSSSPSPIVEENNFLTEKFIDDAKTSFGNLIEVHKKNWGYTIKHDKKIVLTIANRTKGKNRIECFDQDIWVKDRLSEESYGYYLDCLKTIVEGVKIPI